MFAQTVHLKHWVVFVILLSVRGLRNVIKMGVLDNSEVDLLEALNKGVSEVAFDIAVVRNKRRASSKVHASSFTKIENVSVTERRSLHTFV